MRGRRSREFRIRHAKRFERATGVAVVDRSVEPRRRAPYSAGSGTGRIAGDDTVDLLPDLVLRGIEFPHIVSIDDVDVAVFACADGEMLYSAAAVGQVRKQHFAAGAQIEVAG